MCSISLWWHKAEMIDLCPVSGKWWMNWQEHLFRYWYWKVPLTEESVSYQAKACCSIMVVCVSLPCQIYDFLTTRKYLVSSLLPFSCMLGILYSVIHYDFKEDRLLHLCKMFGHFNVSDFLTQWNLTDTRFWKETSGFISLLFNCTTSLTHISESP